MTLGMCEEGDEESETSGPPIGGCRSQDSERSSDFLHHLCTCLSGRKPCTYHHDKKGNELGSFIQVRTSLGAFRRPALLQDILLPLGAGWTGDEVETGVDSPAPPTHHTALSEGKPWRQGMSDMPHPSHQQHSHHCVC